MFVYEAIARAFRDEGVTAHFSLMGDGNMHWVTAMKNLSGIATYSVRHEHSGCAMALGYARATGEVGVTSVTHGPGLTQIMTALGEAADSRTPIVVFIGEVPTTAMHHDQMLDHRQFAVAVGADYLRVYNKDRALDAVRLVFYKARSERRPMILGVPVDLQRLPYVGGAYIPSTSFLPESSRPLPDPVKISGLATLLARAKSPILMAGLGAIEADAIDAIVRLADRVGALLGTTLPAKGLFNGHAFDIGVCGGYGSAMNLEVCAKADLVVAIGASLAHHTIDGGHWFPSAMLAQIDLRPQGMHHGLRTASFHVAGDAKHAVEGLIAALANSMEFAATVRTADLSIRLRETPQDPERLPAGEGLDPRVVIERLGHILPTDCDIVGGSGQQGQFYVHLKNRPQRHYFDIKAFGTIGSGLAWAIGIAAARPRGKVVLFEGDGSLLMHIQEFETLARHGIKLLICAINDGAYGSETHKLRAEGIDDSGSIFGRPNFSSIANGFGLAGRTIDDVVGLQTAYEEYLRHDRSEVWDIHVSDTIVNPMMRRIISRNYAKPTSPFMR